MMTKSNAILARILYPTNVTLELQATEMIMMRNSGPRALIGFSEDLLVRFKLFVYLGSKTDGIRILISTKYGFNPPSGSRDIKILEG